MGNGNGDTRHAIEAYPSLARERAGPQELAAVAADLYNLASLYEARGGVEAHRVYRQREWYSLAAPPFYARSLVFRLSHRDSSIGEHYRENAPRYLGRKLSLNGGGGGIE